MTFATLPNSLVIDGTVHVQHWRSDNHAIYQSYTLPVRPSDNPLVDRAPQIAGQSMFHVYRIIQHDPGEEPGEKIGSYTSLEGAMSRAGQTLQ